MRNLIGTIFVALLLLLSSCAAPGSALGKVGIRANISLPLESDLRLRITLDESYGLGSIDRYFGKPEDYGHKDQVTVLTMKPDGSFEDQIFEVLYHVTYFILPPLGPIPRKAPKPYYIIEFSNIKDEIYVVGEPRTGFEYRTYSYSKNAEFSKDEAYWRITSGEFTEALIENTNMWLLNIKIERNIQTTSAQANN